MSFKQKIPALIILLIISASAARAQSEKTKFNGFGHQEYSIIRKDSVDSYFSIGEHDFFITGNLSPRISFLGEFVVRYNPASATGFLPSIERSFIKFNYINNHSLIAGKIHTPVNYWNDVYHHGRVFFPVIDRPLAFSFLVPLHTLGLQLQGQNLGVSGFGYDVMLGNGIASNDVFQGGFSPALTAAFHIKPVQGMRLGASYFYNHMNQNRTGVHIGHMLTTGGSSAKMYRGPLELQLLSASLAWFGKKMEFLNEFSYNLSRTDTLGTARGISEFAYAGFRINDHNVPYVLLDYINIGDNDLHVYPTEMLKIAFGYRYEFNYLINLKAQVEQNWSRRGNEPLIHDHLGNFGLRLQLAYGF
jgi:hypothetical protein